RGAGSGLCTAAVDDAIDPLTATGFLRTQFKAELLANHPSEEAANRMLLPTGRTHDGSNRRSLRPAKHGEHASLFRPLPAFARGASFGLRPARLMPRANGRQPCNESPLARGDNLDCRCFDFGPVGGRANACLRRSAHRNSLDPDRFEALFGDAKRHGSSFGIASPGQERAIGADLFQQPSADELIHGLAKRFARNVCRQVDSAIIAPRSRGQNDELGIGESCHRDPPLRWCGVIVAATTTAPPRPCSRRGRIPRARRAPGMVTLPLCSRTNASPFWIMLLLSLGVLEHGTIERGPNAGGRAPDYESGGQEFESLRARQRNQRLILISFLIKGPPSKDGVTRRVTDWAVATIPADSIAWPDRDRVEIQVGTEASDCTVGRREVGDARIRIRAVSRHAQPFG